MRICLWQFMCMGMCVCACVYVCVCSFLPICWPMERTFQASSHPVQVRSAFQTRCKRPVSKSRKSQLNPKQSNILNKKDTTTFDLCNIEPGTWLYTLDISTIVFLDKALLVYDNLVFIYRCCNQTHGHTCRMAPS